MSFIRLAVVLFGFLLACGSAQAQTWQDHTTSDNSNVIKRHETGSVVSGNKLYVMGGRGNRPNQVFDAAQNKWSTFAPLPMEMHHFQPVVLNGHIYVIGAFTCCFPEEPTVADIYRLNLASNSWETVGSMPANRLRGSAGAVAHNNKIYIIGGNTNGHSGGAVPWFDEYDPATNQWRVLPNAPKARDHFSAAVVGNKLVAAAGRTTNRTFGGMVAQTDTYNFNTNSWTSSASIPTPRAGSMIGVNAGRLIVMGGETDTQVAAHSEVEAFDVASNSWKSLPDLNVGRHGGAGGVINNILHAISGNINRGGGAEVTDHETLNLSDANTNNATDPAANEPEDSIDVNLDSDGDGLSNGEEQELGTDPDDSDTDNDGLSDDDEVNQHRSNPLQADTDADGLSDSDEIEFGTNLLEADSDFDTLSDIDELQTFNTSPVNADSDGDGLNDQDELQLYFTDPLLADSHNDGLNDDVEVLTFNSNPNSYDTDGDGVSDATEAAEGSNLANSDQDGDGIANNAEGADDPDADALASFLDLDSDNDGIPDIIENGRVDANNDGILDAAEAPTDSLFDADQDGIPNMLDLDSDQDGISDFIESGQTFTNIMGRIAAEDFTDVDQNGWHDGSLIPLDSDNDATPDYLDLDSDDDGINDIVENGQSDVDNDGKVDVFQDANNDGFDDTMANLSPLTTEVNRDAITDVTDTESESPVSGSGGGGSTDPVIPLGLLLLSLVRFARRKAQV